MGVISSVEFLCLVLLVKPASIRPVGLHVDLIRMLELTQLSLPPEWMFRVLRPAHCPTELFQL
mgnify:CR=1 FL=1